ncbi:hypothetical protein D3C75_883020 [compost metagenome]
MNSDKYSRSVSMHCPTCGGTSFEGVEESDAGLLTCASCDLQLTRDELLRENSENVAEHLDEIKALVKKDITKQLQDSLKKAFKGSKNIRLK